jgi:carotenoid 1,2-hydratase
MSEVPRFDRPVPHNGYRWWYIDAISHDGAHACTVIAFIGSVFSPYYAAARRRGPADPANHVALNVALYGLRGPGWAMTERTRSAVVTAQTTLRIGPSQLAWSDGALRIDLSEITAPLPRRLRGHITLRAAVPLNPPIVIDAQGYHRWTPFAPQATVEVCLTRPAWRWSGSGYFDSNEGDRALEQDFATWEWSRAHLPDGGAVVLYDAIRTDGTHLAFARHFSPCGQGREIDLPPRHTLRPGVWRMARTAHGDAVPTLMRVLEDSPFYTRSLIATQLLGQNVTAMHESLSLTRFSARWVQMLLPFRMPRRIF